MNLDLWDDLGEGDLGEGDFPETEFEEPPDWDFGLPEEPPDLFLPEDMLSRLDQYAPPIPASEDFFVSEEMYEAVDFSDEVPLMQPVTAGASAQRGGGWAFQHSALIIEEDQTRSEYALGLIEVWRDPVTGAQSGGYLPLGGEPTLEEAEARMTLLDHIAEAAQIPEHHRGDFFHSLEGGERDWQPLSGAQWALVDTAINDDLPNFMDEATWAARDQMLAEVFTLTDTRDLSSPDFEDSLRELGIQIADFDPASTPPPLYDETTQTAYWIGVFQPDPTNPDEAITSLLALGSDEAGNPTAHLAPVASGNVEQAYLTAEYLLKVAERTGEVGRVLDAAEGMAVATQHRELWDTPQGIPVEDNIPFSPLSLEM